MLAADPRIVRTLEQVRSLVCSPEGEAKDLLKNDTHCQTTLGFRVSFGQVRVSFGQVYCDGPRR